MNKQELLNQMKKQSALIMKAKIDGESQLPYKAEFARLNRKYKAIWLRDYKKQLAIQENMEEARSTGN